MRSNTDFGGKIMTKWEHINNKRSHFHRSYPQPVPFPLVSAFRFPFPWESHEKNGNPTFPIPMHISNLRHTHRPLDLTRLNGVGKSDLHTLF